MSVCAPAMPKSVGSTTTKTRVVRMTNGRAAAANGCGASTRIARETAQIRRADLDGAGIQCKRRVVAMRELDDGHAFVAHARDRRGAAGRIEAAHRLAQQCDAAASAEIGVHDGDALVAHHLRELAAERGRSHAALGADEEEDRFARHLVRGGVVRVDDLIADDQLHRTSRIAGARVPARVPTSEAGTAPADRATGSARGPCLRPASALRPVRCVAPHAASAARAAASS